MSKGLVKLWVFSGIFLPITLSLGFWQLDRAEEKTIQLNAIERMEKLPISEWHSSKDVSHDLHRKFRLIGRYYPKSFLLDNRIKNGKVGYEVLSVFELLSGDWLLVNRGWVPAEKYRSELPEIFVPEGLVELIGSFYEPEGEVPVLKDSPEERGWPRRVQALDWNRLELAADLAFMPRAQFRLADNGVVGAYLTGWPKTSILPEKHVGYAYQWFGLAIALCILTVAASIKLRRV